MRKITEKSIENFNNNKLYFGNNTEVLVENNVTKLYLFGHCIAKKENNKLFITNCGYFTNTTKEHLNGLPNVKIYQKDSKWYLNNELWDGNWIEVK
jgi:hypothetical protein